MTAKLKKRCTGQHGQRHETPDGKPPKGSLSVRKSRSSPRRAAVLIAVHVAILAHITHWAITGNTLSPVEPSESMYTLELGEVNAGFIFFCAAILSTLIFGRFFCGWGCHVVALQDACGWFMKKIGIRPKPFRSRLLVLAPLVLGLYMFVWPTFKRLVLFPLWSDPPWWLAKPVADFPGWSNHLMKADFFATFATSPFVVVPFFLICGFATVYFLGAKGFCTYGCPYGGIFQIVERVTPGRIIANLDACEGCGHCTATCTSNVRVHEEIQIHRQVIDTGCMKCLDCVSVCPNDALSYGFKPSLVFPRMDRRTPRNRYDLSWPEEILLALVFLGTFFGTRGAYGAFPALMSMGIAGCTVFIAWKLMSLVRAREVRIHRFVLRRGGSLRPAGAVFAVLGGLLLLFIAHTGVINIEQTRARQTFATVNMTIPQALAPNRGPLDPMIRERAEKALSHYRHVAPIWEGGWGLLTHPQLVQDRAALHLVLEEYSASAALMRPIAEGLLADGKIDDVLAARLGTVYFRDREFGEGIRFLESVNQARPDFPRVRDLLVEGYMQTRRGKEGLDLYRRWLAIQPKDGVARSKYAALLRKPEDAFREFQIAVKDAPDAAIVQYLMASRYVMLGDIERATVAMAEAVRLAPGNKDYRQKLRELEEVGGEE